MNFRDAHSESVTLFIHTREKPTEIHYIICLRNDHKQQSSVDHAETGRNLLSLASQPLSNSQNLASSTKRHLPHASPHPAVTDTRKLLSAAPRASQAAARNSGSGETFQKEKRQRKSRDTDKLHHGYTQINQQNLSTKLIKHCPKRRAGQKIEATPAKKTSSISAQESLILV